MSHIGDTTDSVFVARAKEEANFNQCNNVVEISNRLVMFHMENLDVFAWEYSDMQGLDPHFY